MVGPAVPSCGQAVRQVVGQAVVQHGQANPQVGLAVAVYGLVAEDQPGRPSPMVVAVVVDGQVALLHGQENHLAVGLALHTAL